MSLLAGIVAPALVTPTRALPAPGGPVPAAAAPTPGGAVAGAALRGAQNTSAPALSGHLPAATVSMRAGEGAAADVRTPQCSPAPAPGGAPATAAASLPAGAAAAADPGWRVPQCTLAPAPGEAQPAAAGGAALLTLPPHPCAAALREAAGSGPASTPAGLPSPLTAWAQNALNDMAERDEQLAQQLALLDYQDQQWDQHRDWFRRQNAELRQHLHTLEASRAAVRAALERTLGQGSCQLGCAGVGHSDDSGVAAASMQPAGRAAVPLGSPVQGRGQLGRLDIGLRPTCGAGTAAACLQPAADAAVALGGQYHATGRAAMAQSAAVLQSGEARPRLDLARFPLGVPSAAELAYARELSVAKGERTAAGARPFTMLRDHMSLEALWHQYAEGDNGLPPLRVLELGGKVWLRGKSYNARWSEVMFLINHIKARAAEWGMACKPDAPDAVAMRSYREAAQRIDREVLGLGSERIGLFTYYDLLKKAAAAAAPPEVQAAAAAKRAATAERRAAAAAAKKTAAAGANAGEAA